MKKKYYTTLLLLLVAMMVNSQSCPDSNHPHMIDLGLSSGTKWACCNVGATKPEGYGNYYAWGETKTKSKYDLTTYQHCGNNLNYLNIGSDIAGTSYDAATANWGSRWQMPSFEQIKELVNNTNSEWTSKNGVKGCLFTSKQNGNSIFIPAAGDRYKSSLSSVGSDGHYWSSTLDASDSDFGKANYLLFYSGRVSTGSYGRTFGFPIRPISKSSGSTPTPSVAINSTNFPDANFRSYIQNLFRGYSSLSSNQIRSVLEININNRNIRDLTGIKYFTSLQRLECDNNNISSLNLSSNTALVYLGCRHNNITNLVLPSSIVTLLCSYNKLTTLNIANLNKLNEIYCDNNNLTSLIVAGNKSVGLIHCYKNRLTTINLSGCTNMSWLACCCNLINGQGAANLVSNLPSSSYCTLDFFHTSDSSEGNSMTSSQVATANGRGWTVYQLYNNSYYTGTGNGTEYRGNDATSNYKITINSSQHGKVTCGRTTAKAGEKITLDIDEDSGYELDALTIRDKNGKTIDRVIETTKPTTGGSFNYYWYATFTMPASDVTVTATFKSKTNGKAIKDYFPDNNFRNYILSLDIGKDGILTDGEIASLTTLNISNLNIESLKGIELFTSLQVLYCYGNKITSIDLSKLTLLRELYIYNNLLTSLDVSYCTRLTTLHCYNNRLTSLIITGCTSLKILYCYLNQLRGQAMTRIVNVLPYTSDGKIRMISISIDEGNSLDGVDTSGVGGRGWTIYDNNGNIYPSKIYVTNITIDIGGGFTISKGGTSIFMLGEKEKFTAIVSPQNATYNKVTWSSSATNIVSVNDGYLEAKAVGEAKITVSANDGSGVSTYFYVKVQTPEEEEYRITINSSLHGKVTCEKTTAKAGEEIVLDIDEDSGYELNTLTIRDKNGNTIEREIKETRPITGGTFNYYRYATFTMPASDVTVSATFKAKESNGIPIIAAHFPDEIFRNYLLTLDCGIDGVLTEDEIMGVTELDVSEKNISDLTGIGLFTELKEINCFNNNLTSLDLSRNTKLTSISCGWNRLTSLDVSKNVELKSLWCESNRLTSLKVSNDATSLWAVVCFDNQIKGEAMSILIKSLPTMTSEYTVLIVHNKEGNEGNVITKSQVKIAKNKGWDTMNKLWEDYEGSDDIDSDSQDIQVAVGYSFSLFVKNDATLWASGDIETVFTGYGETNTPVYIMSDVKTVAAGLDHALILKQDGTLWTCGLNNRGQLGDGTKIESGIPVMIASNVVSIAAGCFHSFYIKDDGSLYGFGKNPDGQLGIDNNREDVLTPVKVMSEVASIETGYDKTFIIKKDGTLLECGEGTFTPVSIMSDVSSVATGYGHSLIVKKDGTLWVYGSNGDGQLGDGTNTSKKTPLKTLSDVSSVAAGFKYSLIVKKDGSLWTCGYNGTGQLGDGTTITRNTPVNIMSNVLSVSATTPFYANNILCSYIVKKDGTIWACGHNKWGQLGDGTNTDRHTPVMIFDGKNWVGATAIDNVKSQQDVTGGAAIYSISGQRLAAPRKGLNIIGGKKVVIK